MKTQRVLIALTVVNLVLLVFLLAQARISVGAGGVRVWTNAQGSVLRGRSLEIIDDEGRVRGSITVHPPENAAAPAGGTAILRLIDENGRPAVKLFATERGGGLTLVEAEGTYVQLFGHGLAVTKDEQKQTIP
jgi:hypothetical protein